MQYDLNGFFMK